jgi:uncharacterized metal-binding protein YceD (DUF177 family)
MKESFAHQLRLDQIRDGDRIDLVADEKERAAVAERLDLEGLERFDAHAVLGRDGDTVRAEGRLKAAVQQRCVVTSEPVPASLDEAFTLMFVPEPKAGHADEEIELGAADCDVVFYQGGAIDLGTAIADSLALSLDPYPRCAGAEDVLKQAGVMSEEEAGPFGALAQLKAKLESGEA